MRDDCEWDFDTVIDYLNGPVDLVMYKNNIVFDPASYGEDRLKKTSTIDAKQINIEKPSWVEAHIDSNEL